ncbi:unnamed protein product [Urochloa decumbens]|uniref:Bifunctional inhibitor/plant lipid transfer protein/seed storage helical domain-containing protein n=1 Tax=Urochloa decumbens TaxID=240449 RepID=A0ABC9FPD8_9POAL
MDSRAAFAAATAAIMIIMSSSAVVGDFAADRAECSDKLVALATCLTYVQDEAAAPTPDCCAGLKTVLQTSRKCLCVLVKDKDDPNLGLKLNVTKALGLPAVCNAPANISDCPSKAAEPGAQLQGGAGVRGVRQAGGVTEKHSERGRWQQRGDCGRAEERSCRSRGAVVGSGKGR